MYDEVKIFAIRSIKKPSAIIDPSAIITQAIATQKEYLASCAQNAGNRWLSYVSWYDGVLIRYFKGIGSIYIASSGSVAVMLRVGIREVLASNLGRNTNFHDKIFVFSSVLPIKYLLTTSARNRPLPLNPLRFIIYYSPCREGSYNFIEQYTTK